MAMIGHDRYGLYSFGSNNHGLLGLGNSKKVFIVNPTKVNSSQKPILISTIDRMNKNQAKK